MTTPVANIYQNMTMWMAANDKLEDWMKIFMFLFITVSSLSHPGNIGFSLLIKFIKPSSPNKKGVEFLMLFSLNFHFHVFNTCKMVKKRFKIKAITLCNK